MSRDIFFFTNFTVEKIFATFKNLTTRILNLNKERNLNKNRDDDSLFLRVGANVNW